MNNENTDKVFNVGSDLPQTDPENDAFGYAPFAKKIADVIQKTPSPQGLVMAIDGEWGSGKSSVLNFITYYLNKLPDKQKPIIIDFNPWWFKDSDDLAIQFLNTFSNQLEKENQTFKKIRDLLADYSDAIGQVAAILDPSGRILTNVLQNFRSKSKSIPSLKKELADVLIELNHRILFIIDDIDRLSPNETRELFKVIKALGDFPNTIYILSFDRKVVSDSLVSSLGVNGGTYLEKIVQLQFSLPMIDKTRLRKKLFDSLSLIFSIKNGVAFNNSYWGNIYFSGLDHYINKPRDIVRVLNGIGSLYPSVAEEVNPVDFISIEFIRVFEPELYKIIVENKEHFTGLEQSSFNNNLTQKKEFHDKWLTFIKEEKRHHIKKMMQYLFPRLNSVWGNTFYDFHYTKELSKNRRICIPNAFDVYFQFGIFSDTVGKSDIRRLIKSTQNPSEAKEILNESTKIKKIDGTPKIMEYLDNLSEIAPDLDAETAKVLLKIILDLGDTLLELDKDRSHGIMSIPNSWRLILVIESLFSTIKKPEQCKILAELLRDGESLSLAMHIIYAIDEYNEKKDTPSDKILASFDHETVDAFYSIMLDRLAAIDINKLIKTPDLNYILHHWIKWTSAKNVINKIEPIFNTRTGILAFLGNYIQRGSSWGMSDYVVTQTMEINPMHLSEVTDIHVIEEKVRDILYSEDLPDDQRVICDLYLKGMGKLQKQKDNNNASE